MGLEQSWNGEQRAVRRVVFDRRSAGFFMQCGFAMVETGFTRAKNAGNIIMKNLMDFCIGTVMFILLGYGLMCGQDYIAGVIGSAQPGHFHPL